MESFDSNLEYLSAHLQFLTCVARKRMLQRGVENRRAGLSAGSRKRYSQVFTDCEISDQPEEVLVRKLANVDRVQADRRRVLTQRIRLTLDENRIELPLENLCREHNLLDFEKMVLVLVLGPTLDNCFKETLEEMTGRSGTEVGGIIDVLCDSLEEKIKARRFFISTGNLLGNGLLNLSYHVGPLVSESDFLSMDVELPRRVSSHLLGEYDIDDQLITFSSIIDPEVNLDQVVLPDGKKEEVLELVTRREDYLRTRREWGLDEILSYGKGIVMLFSGPSGTGKTMLAHALAKVSGHRLMLVDIQSVMNYSTGNFEENLERVFHEARLQHAILFFDEADEMFADRDRNVAMPTLLREFEKLDNICILATNRKHILDEALERRILYKLDLEMPSPDHREQIWKLHLPDKAPVDKDLNLAELAEEFEFTGGFIKNAVLLAIHHALMRPKDEQVIRQEDLRFGANLQRRNRLERQTDKIVPKVSLDDVVLDKETERQVRALLAAARRRTTVFSAWGFGKKMNLGKALSAIFTGPSGVGKTMTAEAIAYELGQNLYVVNLSAVMSKYVGETEKNLHEVFQNAKEAQALLFFDEADSLFSSRLDEASSHGYYINLQVNTLLQEIEKFDGVVILASNRPDAFDKAFERRLRYKIHFPEPDEAARESIWRGIFPDSAPVSSEIDFSRLSRRFNFNGGAIKNVVLRSAFEAATDGGVITQEIVDRCAENENPLHEKSTVGFLPDS